MKLLNVCTSLVLLLSMLVSIQAKTNSSEFDEKFVYLPLITKPSMMRLDFAYIQPNYAITSFDKNITLEGYLSSNIDYPVINLNATVFLDLIKKSDSSHHVVTSTLPNLVSLNGGRSSYKTPFFSTTLPHQVNPTYVSFVVVDPNLIYEQYIYYTHTLVINSFARELPEKTVIITPTVTEISQYSVFGVIRNDYDETICVLPSFFEQTEGVRAGSGVLYVNQCIEPSKVITFELKTPGIPWYGTINGIKIYSQGVISP